MYRLHRVSEFSDPIRNTGSEKIINKLRTSGIATPRLPVLVYTIDICSAAVGENNRTKTKKN